MSNSEKAENRKLAELIVKAGWTLAETASNTNAVAAEIGVDLGHDRTTTWHWLHGTLPRPLAQRALIEALSRQLDLPLTAEDVGLPKLALQVMPDPWHGDLVGSIAQLGRSDMLNRRELGTAVLYSLAVLAVPEPLRTAVVKPPRDADARPATRADIARLRDAAGHLADLDDHYGGGSGRTAVAAYLTHEVSPLLRGTTSGPLRPDLFAAAARIAYLGGWMASDDGEPGVSQRYYVTGIRLADEADDPLMRATILRALAIQAAELRHGRPALDVAQATVAIATEHADPRMLAWHVGTLAEGHALLGDRHAAHEALSRAEQLLERADSAPRSEWFGAYARDALNHQIGLALRALGDHAGATEHLAAALIDRPEGERRARALIVARLAKVHAGAGHHDAAAAALTAHREVLTGVSSARVRTELAGIRADWAPVARRSATLAPADRLLSDALATGR